MPRKIKGIRRHGAGWQIYTRVRGRLLTEQHPLSTTVAALKSRRTQLRNDYLRTLPATSARGTLAADITTYLKTLADRPTLQAARRLQLA